MNIEDIKVYVTAYGVDKSNSGYAKAEFWTLSQDPDEVGWETDSSCSGYGLTLEVAEYYAKCINEYPRLLQELEKVKQDNFQLQEERDSYSRVAFKVEQEKQRIQQENERLIVSLQKLANATNDPSRVKWPEV